MAITSENDAIKVVVEVLKSGDHSKKKKQLDEIFDYIYNTFMMKKNNSGTKGFMNVCIMCTNNFLQRDTWMGLWNKRKKSKTYTWCNNNPEKYDAIGLTQVKAAAKLTPSTNPPRFPEWTSLGKYNILEALVKTVGGGLKKGFPKRCLDELTRNSV